MWMKYVQNKENTTGRPNEKGFLQCPMCKGRGYFEPTKVSNTKSSDYFYNETENWSNKSGKLPRLQTKTDTKQWPNPRYKYSLPSIKNVKNLPENKSTISPDVLAIKFKQNNLKDIESESESRIKTGKSQGLSVTSSNNSNFEKNLIPSPKTPKNPSETLKTSLSKLKANNWNESLNALKEIVQLSRFQPRLVEPSVVIVYRGLIFLLKSFRSIVVRTACQAANELFAIIVNTQKPEFDELINVLLQKTVDTNKAVRQDANEALDTMIINFPASHSIRTIIQKGIPHKSPIVRSASARLLVCVVGVKGIDTIYNGNKETRGKIITAAASFMQDGCQDVRNFGRRLMKMLMEHDDFEEVLQAEVNETLLRRIEKTLITMKYKT